MTDLRGWAYAVVNGGFTVQVLFASGLHAAMAESGTSPLRLVVLLPGAVTGPLMGATGIVVLAGHSRTP
jgi:hypothetical protein